MRDDDLEIMDNADDRSHTPTTEKGSLMDDEDCTIPSHNKLAQDVADLQNTCKLLSHQMTLILGHLNIPRCRCSNCDQCLRAQQLAKLHNGTSSISPQNFSGAPRPGTLLPGPAATPVLPQTRAPIMISATPTTIHTNGVSESTVETELNKDKDGVMEGAPSENGSTSTEGEIMKEALLSHPLMDGIKMESAELNTANQILNTLFPGVLQSISNVNTSTATPNNNNPFAVQTHGGRKSKYCTPDEKKVVAEYASMHGAANAARKFGIPPSVAAYYQRKLAKIKRNDIQVAAVAVAQTMGIPPIIPAATTTEATPSTHREERTTVQPPPLTPTNESPTVHDDMETPTTPTTPGHLRGRGRGRPKLIGDELDASLVEYMVTLRQANPRAHFSASSALEIARAYIMKHAPGLLAEHGGTISLKLTWAMKLVSRIAERQKEIELGLPAGTLSNMGRAGLQQLANVNGANLMAEMTQSFLSQLNQLQGGDGEQPMMPEITNVKELNLGDWGSLDMNGDDDGTVTPDEEEKRMEEDEDDQTPSPISSVQQPSIVIANKAF